MNFSSIKSKLLFFLLICVSLSFVFLAYYNALNAFKAEYSLVKHDQTNVSKQTSSFINDYINSKIQVVTSVASMIENENLTVDNKVLVNQLMLGKKSGDFASMYLGIEESGDLIKFNGQLKSIATMNYDARVRPWYKKAVRIKNAGVTEPFISNSSKKLVITVFAPYEKDGKFIGVVGANIFLDTIVNEILNLKLSGKGLAYLLSSDGNYLVHKDKTLLKKSSNAFKQIRTNEEYSFSELTENGIDKLFAYSKVKSTSWYLVIEIEKDSIFEEIKNGIIKVIFLYVALLITILGVIYFVLRKLLNPLDDLEKGLYSFFEYLKGEKQSVELLDIQTNDEFGNMSKKINTEIDFVRLGLEKDKKLIENVKDVVNEIKVGNLDIQVKEDSTNQSLNELKEILNDMINAISENVHNDINVILESLERYSNLDFIDNIDRPTGKISKGLNNLCDIINEMLQENYHLGVTLQNNAKTLLQNVDVLNVASNETAVSLEETSASVEEITTTIIETTSNIGEMVNYSNNLLNSIKDGQKLASITVESMNEINEQATAIAEAITVIDQIAFQTNILSLNAAVEAATAGEAGKGFAVVAQEVRNLASRSAEAAKEIKSLVENATIKTNNGKKNADQMIEGYNALNENIQKTTEVIAHIEKASIEQKVGMEQINDAIIKLDSRTQQNANVAAQTHEVSTATSNISKNILDNVGMKKFRKI